MEKNHFDLTDRLMAEYQPKAGVVGRYSVSKLWAINNNWCTPEQYLKGEEVKFENALLMKLGTCKHELVQSLLPEYQHEIKIEKNFGDFVLVGKCDAINDKEVLEIKTSDKVYSEAKRWAIHQLKCYLTLFERPEGVIVQPIVSGNKLLLKEIGREKRDDKWFEKEIEKLAKFHQKLCQKK